MISISAFKLLDNEVKKSVTELFDWIERSAIEHNYMLFLADAEFWEEYKLHTRYSSYVIDSRIDHYKDLSRKKFLIRFLDTFYSFPNQQKEVPDDEYRISMELMAYTHVWESKSFLKQLFRLGKLAAGQSYPWMVKVPDMSKHLFIRENIRNVFKQKDLKIAGVISKGFHTSLRNAFAHSEYQIDMRNKIIHLDTFKGGSWDIDKIKFDDWTKRFIYTVLLSYYILNEKAMRRQKLGTERPKRLIIHPLSSESHFTTRYMYYNPDFDSFGFHGM